MNKKKIPHFILIDDDPINNIVCLKVIQRFVPEAVIKTFTDPEIGLQYIQTTYMKKDVHNAILFLDINMPSLTGWDVLERFRNFSDWIKEHIKIFMLTSSVNSTDKERASNNSLVSGFMSKPLSGSALRFVLPEGERSE